MSSKKYISIKNESARMFKWDFLEFFSHVHFSIPLFIYVPIALFLLYQALFVYSLSALSVLGLFFTGAFIWSFTEYTLHRFVFHFQPSSEFGKRVHFIAHGVHHDYPNDATRLVFPPILSIPLALVFYYLFSYIGTYFNAIELVAPLFAGFIAGYLAYDTTHYALHHAKFKNKYFLALKKHHMIHHFHDPENGFGVSSKLWDKVFRTKYKANEQQEDNKL